MCRRGEDGGRAAVGGRQHGHHLGLQVGLRRAALVEVGGLQTAIRHPTAAAGHPSAATATCCRRRHLLVHEGGSGPRAGLTCLGGEGREDARFLVAGKLTIITKHHN